MKQECFDAQAYDDIEGMHVFVKSEELGLDSLEDIRKNNYGIMFFVKTLERIICKTLGIELEKVRHILYYNPNFTINLEEEEDINNFYQLLHCFFSYNSPGLTSDGEIHGEIVMKHFVPSSNFESIYHTFKTFYLNDLCLSISEAYENKRSDDPGFKTYGKHLETIKTCEICKSYFNNILTDSCDIHSDIAMKVFCEFFDYIYFNTDPTIGKTHIYTLIKKLDRIV